MYTKPKMSNESRSNHHWNERLGHSRGAIAQKSSTHSRLQEIVISSTVAPWKFFHDEVSTFGVTVIIIVDRNEARELLIRWAS